MSVCLIELLKNSFIDFNNYCVLINWLFGFNEMKTTLHIKEEPINATNNTGQSQRVVYTYYGSLVDNNTCSIEHATSIAIGQYSQCYFKFCNWYSKSGTANHRTVNDKSVYSRKNLHNVLTFVQSDLRRLS